MALQHEVEACPRKIEVLRQMVPKALDIATDKETSWELSWMMKWQRHAGC